MIYGGDLMSNFSGGAMSKDVSMTKDIVISTIYHLIDKNPKELITSLKASNVAVSVNPTKKELINKSIDALYFNEKFQQEISKYIASTSSKFSNSDGGFMEKISGLFGGGGGGSTSGGTSAPEITVGADPVSAIAGAIGSIFSFAGVKAEAKAQAEADKNRLISGLLADDDKKTNWLPIVIIGGVLVLGGIVAVITLKSKK